MISSLYQHQSLQLGQDWLGGSLVCPMDYRFEPSTTFYEIPGW